MLEHPANIMSQADMLVTTTALLVSAALFIAVVLHGSFSVPEAPSILLGMCVVAGAISMAVGYLRVRYRVITVD